MKPTVSLSKTGPERRSVEQDARRNDAVMVSARTGEGRGDLLAALDEQVGSDTQEVQFRIPFERGDVLARVHRQGHVLRREEDEHGTRITARVSPKVAGQIEKLLQGNQC